MTNRIDGSAKGQLQAFVARIERINGDIAEHQEDRKAVFGEAKSSGFDVKILRKVIALRKKSKSEADEEAALLELYLEAVGWDGTPLGAHASDAP